ncbi:MAG: cell surface protein SprA [Bacteroidetes bacterium]|nr:cell surface protein SprA [Bacteroidota bacterium]MBS1648534.1 cell surface protein SprA [Bacteroidota bacterium]
MVFLITINCVPLFVQAQSKDSIGPTPKDSLRFPIHDRRGDRFTWKNNNPFDLSDTGIIQQNIIYDPKTNEYYIEEKVGKTIYRKPTSLTFEQFYLLRNKQYEAEYFKQRANALTLLNKKVQRPKPTVYDKLFDRIFGVGANGLKVDVKPQGSVDVLLGYDGQNTLNPTLPERARKTGGFDFNMNANLNVNANIGDKLKLPISYNTQATFDYLNQLKLDYKGMDDEILKSVEAGNISFQTKSTLIGSVQNLFGIKTQLQFGKLFITAAIANQRSQRQTQTLKGGAALSTYQKKLDDYEENRHFLLAQYMRNNYNTAMSNLPIVNSQVQIQRIEVWVTNRTGATTNARDVVGFMDLGENQPYNTNIHSLTSSALPQNQANDLYGKLTTNPANRSPALVISNLQAQGLQPINDFEKVFARKLAPTEYYFNPQIGFLSLSAQLQPDDVLAVAYQYTYNGRVYQVGEFSQDVALDSTQGVQKVLFLKLLKATSARTALPIWKLMMKNVYSIDMAGISKDGFQMNVLYNQPSAGLKRYLPEADAAVDGKALLSILQLDRLNSQNDPQPDGVFDFVEGFTVLSQQGKIIFPVLEPFGSDLERLAFNSAPALAFKNKYLFQQLYDSIKAIAQTFANLDRFVMQGQAKGSGTSEIYLNAANIPQGSVKVNAAGQTLIENIDYVIDYNIGSLKIINQAILNSGVPINVSYENNAAFGIQQRGFMGVRLDYLASKKLSLGATYERLNERPFFTKTNYGEDPIRNSMYGVDFSYKANWPGLTRALNKLPFFNTKAMSSITAYGEGAYFKPGHPPQIGKGDSGLIYLDDFEGARSNIDLRFPLVAWALASTPANNGKFPEATLSDSVDYGKNRAKLAWYNIEPNLQDKNSSNNPLRGNLNELSDPRVRLVYTNELFPQQTTNIVNTQTTTFDLAFYPKEMGPYNYETSSAQIDANGKFKNPSAKWGGLMRSLDQTDFETNNFEFIEFWVQDPFIKTPNSTGGQLYFDLGSVSEDILKDGKRFYENGLTTPTSPAAVDSTSTWGTVPVNPIQVTNAFSNDANDRPYQDVGFDGLDNNGERRKRAGYLNQLAATFGTASALYQKAINDPSNDDYVWYRDAQFDATGTGILGRYKNYNNPQGNSPVSSTNSQFASAATLYPDNEDLNHDNTLNETEEYYEYQVNLKPGMDVGNTKYITDKRVVPVTYANGTKANENWYLFRIPIKDYAQKVGQIPDFKSIRFIRMYMTGFQDSVIMRFASLNLVRNTWRQFTYEVDTTGSYTPINTSVTTSNTLAVNLEENSSRTPVNYVIPPGIERVQTLSNNGVNLLQNEQSLSIQVKNLLTGNSRGVFKTLPNCDMRNYGRLSMFVHAESIVGQVALNDNDLNIVVRIGQDFLNNYYEIKYPLKVTLPGYYSTSQAETVWPTLNNLDFNLQDLITVKTQRNATTGASVTNIFRQIINGKTISVLGNPNLGAVTGILVAVQNAKNSITTPLNAEVWIDELRLSEINEQGAYAATGKVEVQLADLGRISVSANTYTQGWGSLESHINDRARDNMMQFDAAASIDAGRLLPKAARLSIPVYASYNRIVHTPQYDPFDNDILYKTKLNLAKSLAERDSIKNAAIDQTTIATINFTNVRVMPKGKIHIWSISNFDVSYSVTQILQSNPTVLSNNVNKWRLGLGYTFNKQSKFTEPLKKVIKGRSQWLSLVRDFNFNLMPSLLSFRSDINRQFAQFIPRIVNTDLTVTKVQRVDTTYDKYFTFDRFYNLRWDLSRSINIDFSAIDNARVDEPYGLLNTQVKKDTVRNNFWKGGRNTLYTQRATASYTFPLNKFPLTDWITARYTYGTSYNWIGASLLARTLGNTLENTQENSINGQFDFSRLYMKSKWLRSVNNASFQNNTKNTNIKNNNKPIVQPTGITIKPRNEVIRDDKGNLLKGKAKRQALAKWRQLKRDDRLAKKLQQQNMPYEMSEVAKTAGTLITMVKHVTVDYSENYHSRVPGYLDSTQFLGQNWRTMQPGLGYVFGQQPDTGWLNDKSRKNLISRDSTFNAYYRQNFEQKLRITAQIEPIKEFRIDLSWEKSFSKEYSELFKDTTNTGIAQQHLSPYVNGGFSVSYISFGTLFKSSDPNEVSQTFKNFEANRIIVSQRVAALNPYYSGGTTADGFAKGYGRYAQDVLIPSFLAAYTGKSAKDISLLGQSNGNIKSNPFSGILPKPNWRVTYTGLTKIPALQKIFSAITLTHAYSGTLSMNSYTSALLYSDPFKFGAPGFIDTVSGNYIPFYLVPNITVSEAFAPLIGIDVTTTKQLNLKFEYRKSRQLSLSLIDYQLSQTLSTEWVTGFSWRKRGLNLPFRLPGMKNKKLQNDLSIKLDLGFRDDATSNSRLDQSNAYGTGGQKVITIQPSIDYVLNNRLNIKFYFYQQRVTPYISTSAPTIVTRAGLQFRISLAP